MSDDNGACRYPFHIALNSTIPKLTKLGAQEQNGQGQRAIVRPIARASRTVRQFWFTRTLDLTSVRGSSINLAMQDNVQDHVAAWRLQVKKGTLELAVMALLRARPSYGLELLERLNECGLEVKDGTIYPLLSRLRTEEKVSTKWIDETSGHAHKYYTLTHRGLRVLDGMIAAWHSHKDAIDHALGEAK